MGKFQDLTGQKFGRLTVKACAVKARILEGKRLHTLWECVCDCGEICVRKASSLKNETTRSCGCLQREVAGNRSRTHGYTSVPEYDVWLKAVERITDPSATGYHRYGGRGLSMCEAWLASFDVFLQDMGPRPSSKYTLERIDNDKGYEPDNCRWATRKEQSNNMSSNVVLDYNGETKTIAQWCSELGHVYSTIRGRVRRYGWTVVRALETPSGRGRGGSHKNLCTV